MNQVSSLRNDRNHNSGTLNLTVIWCFRLGACELVHISVCERETERAYSNYTAGLRCNRVKI